MMDADKYCSGCAKDEMECSCTKDKQRVMTKADKLKCFLGLHSWGAPNCAGIVYCADCNTISIDRSVPVAASPRPMPRPMPKPGAYRLISESEIDASLTFKRTAEIIAKMAANIAGLDAFESKEGKTMPEPKHRNIDQEAQDYATIYFESRASRDPIQQRAKLANTIADIMRKEINRKKDNEK